MSMLSALVLGAVLQERPFPTEPIKLPEPTVVDGKKLVADKDTKAVAYFFIATDCPIANRYAPEIARITSEYKEKGVLSYRVYLLDPSEKETIVAHGKEFSLNVPALVDPELKLVKALGVRVTPEVAVVGKDGTLLYRGRIDDRNIEHGQVRPDYRRDLRLALDEIVAGKPVSVKETAAIGCFISDIE